MNNQPSIEPKPVTEGENPTYFTDKNGYLELVTFKELPFWERQIARWDNSVMYVWNLLRRLLSNFR